MCICRKRYTQCTLCNGVHGAIGQSPWEFSRIFVLKVTLDSARLLLTVSYRKMEDQDVVAPPILLSEQLLPLLPRFPRLCS